jgi:uncharacterized protein (TIGR02271 family)
MTRADDRRGRIETAPWPLDGTRPEGLVQLDDGPQVLVPPEGLHRQDGGRYTLHPDPAGLEDRQVPGSTISGHLSWRPIMVEALGIKKPQVETGHAGISKTVHERQGIVDNPLCREEVSIERVPIRRFVDRAMPVRYEGDTVIAPPLEEVLVVEKRLMSKEKLRLPGRQLEAHLPVGVRRRRSRLARSTIKQSHEEKSNGQDGNWTV